MHGYTFGADTEAAERGREAAALVAVVLGWLGGRTVAEMDRPQLEHAARLTASALDLEGWHARRRGGRNYDWEALVIYAGGPNVRQAALREAVERVRAALLERLWADE